MYKKTKSANVEEYIKTTPEMQRSKLIQIHNLIKEAVPEREEKISYDMPTFRYRGKVLLHFAAQKHHIGLYAFPESNIEFLERLKPYKTGKGSIQFPNIEELPLALISDIIQFRIETIDRM